MEYNLGGILMPINQFDDYPLSWRPIKAKLARPIYKSLIKQLEEDIISGKLQKNTRLPSQRELADYLDINFTTVGSAYKYGIEKGLLYTNIGSGTYISQNAFSSITISTDRVDGHVIDLGLVSSFEECNSKVVPYIQTVSQKNNIFGLLNYQEPLGTRHQLEVACQWLTNQGIEATSQNTAIVSGVQNGLMVVLSSMFSPGDRIAIDRYTYSNFIELLSLLHLEAVPIDFDQEGMLPDDLAIECKKKKIHGIFLMPSCNNPMGFQMSLGRIKELVELIKKENLWVIEDDIHAFMTSYYQKKLVPSFYSLVPDKTFYLAGMTKFICAGLRIAYLVFPLQAGSIIRRSIFNINVKTSGFDAEVITQILSSETANEILKEKFTLTEQANKLFDEYFELPRPSNLYPFYRIIPIKQSIKQNEIENDLLEKGVRVYHSNRFTTQQQKDPFIRLALSSNNLTILEQGLSIIKKSIDRYLE